MITILIKSNIQNIVLDCGLNFKLASLESNLKYMALAVKYGAKSDNKYIGTAHFLEHMLLEFETSDYNIDTDFFIKGTTNINQTVFTVVCVERNFTQALNILKNIAFGYTLNEINMEKVRNDIIREYSEVSQKSIFNMYKIYY